jgi:surfactin synthase thioesterase subunit
MSGKSITAMREVSRPALRLFLFHPAGGSHLLYRDWPRHFPHDWELCTIDAPGRGRLPGKTPYRDADSLVTYLLPELTPLLDRPFALFGHSMGGIVAYHLSYRLTKAGLPRPAWLGVSARRGPTNSPPPPESMVYPLPDEQLKQFVRDLGGTPDAVLAESSLWAMIAPILRADLCASETWYSGMIEPFTPPPISVFGGTEDPVVSDDQLNAWSNAGSAIIGQHRFPGSHFFINDCLPELSRKIVADVTTALARLDAA